MDVRSWRKILLQWITECSFMEHNYFNIEQTNIDAFFRNFSSKHKVASEFDTLRSFLETHYPDFKPNIDDENALSSADYIYIYSLLLHFCCVKCPDEHFHGICQKLSEQAQQCIAAFFKQLLDCSNINKKHLRHAIAEVAATYMSSSPVQQNPNESLSSTSGSSTGAISVELQTSFSSSPSRVNADTSSRTPKRKVIPVVQRISPSTPKSFLLEERTRELYSFKAQLETERYEKGLLELQILQNEQQIFTLNQVQKKMQQQIQTLKDEILNQSAEPNRNQNEDEQQQKRLSRQVSEKEDEIFRLNERIRNLCEEKTLLENKMRHADKKVLDYRQTINELELQLNELAAELEKKESTIKCLTDDKAELEHFIAESRTASTNSHPNFNSSSDCLDSSFARFTNSSGSLGSPENLGVSVVDVQLREKEHENTQLRQELAEMHANNKKLSNYIKEKTELYQKEHNFEIINAAIAQQDEVDIAADFNSFVDCMNHLSQSYNGAKELLQKLEGDVCSLQEKNCELKIHIDNSKQEIGRLNECLKNAQDKNEAYKKEIDKLEKLKNELTKTCEITISNFEAKLKESEANKEQLVSYIEGLNEKIRLQMRKIESLDLHSNKLKTDKQDLEKKCDEIQAQLEQCELQNRTLRETIELQNCKLQTHMEAEKSVKQRYELLLIQNEEMLKKSRETNGYLQSMRADISAKETELSKLGKEIVQLGKSNAELEERIKNLVQNFEEKQIKHDKEIQELQKNLKNAESKLEEKCHHFEDLKSKMEGICKEIETVYLLLDKQTDKSSPVMQLNEIKATVVGLLTNKKENLQKIDQLKEDNKQSNEKLQKLEDKLRAKIEKNEQLLSQHNAEMKEVNKNLLKAQTKIEHLEAMIKEMTENHQKEILNERKQIEILQKEQEGERTKWQSKQEQLEAELIGEKEVRAAKDAELAIQIDKLEDLKQQLQSTECQLKELQETQKETQNAYKETVIAFETKVESLGKENAELRIKLNSDREELISKANELVLFKEKYEETEQQFKMAELKLGNLQKTIENIQSNHAKETETYKRSVDSFKNELKNEQEAIAAKTRELEICTERHKKTFEQLKSVKLQINELNKNIETAQNENVALQQDLSSKIQKLTEENAELQTSKQQLEAKIAAESELRLNQQQESESVKQELQTTKNLLQTLQQTCQNVELEKLKLEKNIKALNAQNEQYIAEIEKLKNENGIYEKRLLETDTKLKELIIELEKATAMVNERNMKLEESQHMLTVASEKLEEKTKIWKSMQLTCEKQSEELENTRKNTIQLQELIQKQSSELESLESITKERSNELSVAQKEIDKLKSDLKEAVLKHDEREDEVKSLSQKLSILQAKYDETKVNLEQVSKEAVELKSSIEEKDQHVEQLRGLIKETEACLKSVNDECTKIQSEIVAKEAEVRMINDELKQVNERERMVLGIIKENEETAIDMLNLLEKSLIDCNMKNDTTQVPSTKDCEKPILIRLKDVVNTILAAISQQQNALKEIPELQCRLSELNVQQKETLANCDILKAQLKTAEQTIEELENQKNLLEKKIAKENERYTNDLENLEQVNKKLCGENETLQLKISNKESDLETLQINYGMLKAVNERLTKAQESLEVEYTKTIEALNSEQRQLKETLKENEKAFEKLQQQFNELKLEKEEKETTLQNNVQVLQKDLEQLKAEKLSQSEELLAKQEECTALASKCDDLEFKNTELNTQEAELQKECINLRVELAALNEKYMHTVEELATNASQLDEVNVNCAAYSEKLTDLSLKHQQLERNFKNVEAQLSTSNTEIEALLQQKDALLKEREKLSEELDAFKCDCRDLKQMTHNLNQKLALADLEKDDLRRQLELLRTQVEVNSRYQTTSESKLKDIVETSQALERNLLSSENALKTTRATLDQFKLNTEKLSAENKKLREKFEALNKRVEKMAVKLGDALSCSDKFQRENEKLVKASEVQATTIESLQRERDIQQLECKTLRERLNRIERLNDQYLARVQTAEKSNATLIAAKQKLEASEVDMKSKISKMENSRQIMEERLRKMTHNYERCERENVGLNHQIGALNTEIQMLKNNRNTKLDEVNKNLTEIRTRSEELEEVSKKLSSECCDLRQQNQCLTDQLSKVVLALEVSKANCDQLSTEVQQLETELKKLHQEKISLDETQRKVLEQLDSYKSLYEKTLSEKRELEQKILVSNNDLVTKDAEISALRKEIDELRQNAVDNSASLADKANNLVAEVESLRTRLRAGEVMLEKEQENNAKLRSDNQILLAKYREAKQRAETEVENSEERIKENRLELEGKLEKMKNKMKVLYTEEITKMKAKQERETGKMRSELSILKDQNLKYEEHTRKLSAELMTLNDRMLEYQKENAYLLTKLKYAQNENTQFKRPNNTNTHISTSTMPRLSSLQNIPTNIGTDLAMEDEEGEIFNNTYLTDMKNGRMSEICPAELQHRNSLLPPHLKSAYAVQYDHGLCEDEVKDGASNGLDDSMSALLNNNSNCIRKKIIGVTHYRKPGPPTPSKNGGRLSFGGNSEPSREILKESYDDNVHTSSVKTPARFGFFSSRFSMGNSNITRDENSPPKRRLSSIFKRKA